jgi:hypothetical protein
VKIYNAVQLWLKERLHLEISEEKSRITDVRKTASEFLGFKIKARIGKKHKYVAYSNMTDKAKLSAQETIKEQIANIKKHPTRKEVYLLNRIIAGLHNSYKAATNVNQDFREINNKLSYRLTERLRFIQTKSGAKSKEYLNKYGHIRAKEFYVLKSIIYPIQGVRTQYPLLFQQNICNFTIEGRETLHKRLGSIDKDILYYFSHNPKADENVEFNDNRISLYCAQQGICRISGKFLEEDAEVLYKIPPNKGGTDEYKNLVLVTKSIYKLVNENDWVTARRLQKKLKLDKKALNKVNGFRKALGKDLIVKE